MTSTQLFKSPRCGPPFDGRLFYFDNERSPLAIAPARGTGHCSADALFGLCDREKNILVSDRDQRASAIASIDLSSTECSECIFELISTALNDAEDEREAELFSGKFKSCKGTVVTLVIVVLALPMAVAALMIVVVAVIS